MTEGRKKIYSLLCAVVVIFAVFLSSVSLASASSGVPNTLSYQGTLTDSGGNALGGPTGTSYYFRFSIWDSPTVGQGSKLWPSSAPGSVPLSVRLGVFNVNIGDTTNGYPDALNYDFNTNQKIYLQVEVSSDNTNFETLSPRSSVTSAAFAQVANQVSGTNPTSFGTTTSFANTLISAITTGVNQVAMTIKGIAGQVANLFNIQDSSGNFLFSVASNGNVGVGTSTPGAKFSVGGDAYIGGNLTATGTVNFTSANINIGSVSQYRFDTNNFTFYRALLPGIDNTYNIGSASQRLNTLYIGNSINSNNGNLSINTGTGSLGIGTTSPSAKLDVWGNLNVGTSSTPALFVNTATGNVGVGTSSPIAKLHIDSTDGLTPKLLIQDSSIASYPEMFRVQSTDAADPALRFMRASSASGDYRFMVRGYPGAGSNWLAIHSYNKTDQQLNIHSNGNVGINNTVPAYTLDVKGNGSVNPFNVATSTGTSLFTVLGNGNVGIGIANPAQLFTVSSATSTTQLLLQNTQVATGGQDYWSSPRLKLSSNMWNSSAGSRVQSAYFQLIGTSQGNPPVKRLGIFIGEDAGTTYEAMSIDGVGNVGIGTTSPSTKLDVWGNLNVGTSSTPALFVNSAVTNVGIGMNNGVNALAIKAQASNDGLSIYSSTNNEQEVFLGLSSSRVGTLALRNTASTKISLNASGISYINTGSNFGVGTGTPSAMLDVWGNLQVGTSSTPALFVNTATGNVGIGTATPVNKLNVVGNVSIQQAGGVANINQLDISHDGTTAILTNKNNAASVYNMFTIQGTGNLGSGTQSFSFDNVGQIITSASNFRFNTSGGQVASIDTTGYKLASSKQYLWSLDGNPAGAADTGLARLSAGVLKVTDGSTGVGSFIVGGSLGIGTTTPGAKLDITTSGASSVGQKINLYSGQTANAFQIQNNSGTVLTSFDSAGSLGIGATSTAKLNIWSTGSGSGLVVGANSVSNPVVSLSNNGAGAMGSASAILKVYNVNATDAGPTLDVQGTGSGPAAVFRYGTVAMGVAVGAISPAGQLQINSSASTTKTLVLRGASGQTANTFEIQDSAGNIYSSFDKTGQLGIGTTSPSAQLHTTGTVRFQNFGAGTLTTDASGNVSVSSDERLKNIEGEFTSGIDAIKGIVPISFKWKPESGLEISNTYTGFSAQNVQQFIPEAVGVGPNGYLTLQDRPILATAINAIKELATKVSSLFDGLGEIFVKKVRTEELCIDDVCITKNQLKDLLQKNGLPSNSNAVNINSTGTIGGGTGGVGIDTDTDIDISTDTSSEAGVTVDNNTTTTDDTANTDSDGSVSNTAVTDPAPAINSGETVEAPSTSEPVSEPASQPVNQPASEPATTSE